MKTIAIVVGLLVVLVGFPLVNFLIFQSAGVKSEAAITNQYDQMKNQMSAYSTSIVESAQVPEIMKNDLKELIQAGVEGRYGADGANNVFLSIQEAYPGQLSPEIYVKLQNQIEAGRNNFANEQKRLVEMRRAYEVQLNTFWSGLWLGLAGYPKINLADYEIITDARTQEVFTNKLDAPISLGQ